jgi:hypothetical protein
MRAGAMSGGGARAQSIKMVMAMGYMLVLLRNSDLSTPHKTVKPRSIRDPGKLSIFHQQNFNFSRDNESF